jgi:hypothetical protein
MVSASLGSDAPIFSALDLAASISPQTRSIYGCIRSSPNTPEAKLQKVHFALQNGTEM